MTSLHPEHPEPPEPSDTPDTPDTPAAPGASATPAPSDVVTAVDTPMASDTDTGTDADTGTATDTDTDGGTAPGTPAPPPGASTPSDIPTVSDIPQAPGSKASAAPTRTDLPAPPPRGHEPPAPNGLRHAAPVPAPVPPPTPFAVPGAANPPWPPASPGAPLPPDRLRVILGNAIMRQVSHGWRVESRFENHAILSTGGQVNHPAHLLATFLTCGAWLPVWVVLGVTGAEKRISLTVDPNGVLLFDGRPLLAPPPAVRPRRGPVVRPWYGNANAQAIAAANMRRDLRRAAREHAEQDLVLARELRIGRPDLPREFDDGGLIDLNHVPSRVLTSLTGITPEIAERIVSLREDVGLFASAEELVATADLHPDLLSEIKEYGIFLP